MPGRIKSMYLYSRPCMVVSLTSANWGAFLFITVLTWYKMLFKADFRIAPFDDALVYCTLMVKGGLIAAAACIGDVAQLLLAFFLISNMASIDPFERFLSISPVD